MTVHLKINGFGVGVGGVGVDKTFYSELDAADVPFLAIAHDCDPYDALQVARARVNSGKANTHTVIYRRTNRIDSAPNYDPNVPDYNDTPYNAAARHWAYHKSLFPALVRDNKDLVWVITTNEPNKDTDQAVEWLAEFSIYTAQMAMADGYKWAAFGWSGGTPEPRHWRQPRMVEFLRLAAANRGKVAVALHEYSWTIADIWNGRNGEDYSQVGRFTKLIEACDEQGIGHPDIFVTEWGWSEHDVPTPTVAMQHIIEVGELYARYPAIKGAAVWYLGPGYQDIYKKAAQLVEPLKQLCLSVEYEVEEPAPPPANKTLDQRLWDASVQQQIEHGVMLNPAAGLQIAINKDGLNIVTNELGTEGLVIQAAETYDNSTARRVYVWENGKVRWFYNPYETPAPSDPFSGLQFGQPLDASWKTVVGGEFNAPRDYSALGGKLNDKHEGVDATPLIGGIVHTLNVWPGTVVYIGVSAGYGNNLIVQHEINGNIFNTRRAHLESISVNVGQLVGKGAVLGVTGSTGNSTGKHDHLTMTSIEYGMPGYIVSNVVDPTPFYPSSIVTPPPTGETINIRAYFEPVSNVGPMKVIAWLDGSKTQPQQLIKRDGFVIEAKGEGQLYNGRMYYDYERRRFVNSLMEFWEDTSRGNFTGYTQHGARWLPEVCEIGRQYVNTPRVTVYNLVNCAVLSDATTTDYLTVTKRHATWDTPAGTINNVIEVEWRKSPTGPVEEIYFYGANIGLVGWGVGTLEAVLSELPQGRTPLNPALWGCG